MQKNYFIDLKQFLIYNFFNFLLFNDFIKHNINSSLNHEIIFNGSENYKTGIITFRTFWWPICNDFSMLLLIPMFFECKLYLVKAQYSSHHNFSQYNTHTSFKYILRFHQVLILQGNEIYKTVFVAFFQGEQLKSRVKKVCSGYHASFYNCPSSFAERQDLLKGVKTRIEDLNLVRSCAKVTDNFHKCRRPVSSLVSPTW